MEPRSVNDWKLVLSRLPSPEGASVELVVANRVLNDLAAYRHGARNRVRDAEELANAMQAWAELVKASTAVPVDVLSQQVDAMAPPVYRDK